MSTDPADGFAQSYAEARAAFRAAATDAGLTPQAHVHPQRGHDGEELALDVARAGAADAPALLVVSSACHGVEGFCGSGIQVAMLRDGDLHAAAAAAGVAVLYLHALNPHGFSHWRRTTEDNVDLNRNFVDFDQPLPHNAGYDVVAPHLLPEVWPPDAAAEAALAAYAAAHGERGLQAAVTGGQYHHPDGLFYGGQAPTWSHRRVREVLREHAAICRRLGWIDLHTGLGPSGHGERILAARDDAATLARAKAWWGTAVTSLYDGSSSAVRLSGLLFEAAYREAPQAEYTGIALEYGTLPLEDTIRALRASHWLRLHPQAPAEQARAIRRQMRDAFYVDTAAWKRQVVEQGLQAARQAVAGLGAA